MSPTQVTSVWPLRFPVLCVHGSPVAEPVSMSLSTVLHKSRFVFLRVALVWLELLTAHGGPGPRGCLILVEPDAEEGSLPRA